MGESPARMRRRTFLQGAAGAVILAAGCGGEDKSAQPTTKGAAPTVEFSEPTG
jgi:hypothetical protein